MKPGIYRSIAGISGVSPYYYGNPDYGLNKFEIYYIYDTLWYRQLGPTVWFPASVVTDPPSWELLEKGYEEVDKFTYFKKRVEERHTKKARKGP